MKDPDGHYWNYEWDADGGLRTVWNSYNQTTTLTHAALGREVQRTLANGVSVNRTFDAAGRETVLRNVDAAGTTLSGYTATYDPAGNRLTVLELDGTRVTYTHDAANQLTREQRGGAHPIDDTLQYDGVGNRVSKVDATGTTTYQVNAANELVLTTPPTGAPTTSTWDADGNLATEQTGSQLTAHTWDTDNRLVRIDKPDGTWETNTYRADGLRSSHEDTDGLVYFVLDGQNVLLEKNSSKVTRAIYTQLPGVWSGAFSYRRGADHYYLLPDFQGHTRQLTNAAGAIFEPHIYDAWGREIWPIVTTGLYLRGFGQWGYWRDTASRLYVRARHLRVDLGRWLSRDSIGFEGSEKNLHRYVRGAPTLLVDPTGMVSCRYCQKICLEGGNTPANCEHCVNCWAACDMNCSEWSDPLDPPIGCPGTSVPVFITCYVPPMTRPTACAVYCSRAWCSAHGSISPGSDRPLCDVGMNASFTVPGLPGGPSMCHTNNAGCGQHPGHIPRPNDWLDWPDTRCHGGPDGRIWKCWKCLTLPPGCRRAAVSPPPPSPNCGR